MKKMKCPYCGAAIKVNESLIHREGEKHMIECHWCHKRIDIEAQFGPEFKIDGNNSPDEFWNKLN